MPGATNLQVVVEIDIEPGYDFFQAADAAGELIVSQDGVDTLSVSVVGDTVDLGVTSDPSVSSFDSGLTGNTYQGYRILGVSFE